MGTPPAGGRLVGGRYRLEGHLGRGGMGVVWHGRDEVLGRAVTVKEVLLPPGLSGEERDVLYQRTLREARAAARLDHPNVVFVYDVVEEDGRPWIVMELVRARSLGQVIRDDGPLPPRQVAEIGRQVLAALRAAHAAGVLHRDVKPSNVLLADDGRVVLTDFGIAAVEGDATLTGSGTLLGSPAYIAPERARGERATAASDLWALGAMLYATVEGRPPYDRGAAMPTLTAVVTEQPDPVRRAGPLRPVIEGLLRKAPGERLVADDVERLLGGIAAPPLDEPTDEAQPALAEHGDHESQEEDVEQTRALSLPRPSEPVPEPAAPPEPVESAAPTESRSPATNKPARTDSEPGAAEPARRQRAVLVAGVCALAVVAGALTGWVVLRDDDRPTNPSAHGSPRPASSPPGRAAGPAPPPETPETGRSPAGSSQELPDGFHRHRDPTGFSVAVPDGWQVSRDGPRVRFEEPDGGRLLIIDQTDNPQPDPVADWEQQEEARRATLAGYRRIRIDAVDYQQQAADWEFTYAGDSGRIHVLNRGFITGPDQAYAIYWSTPHDQWRDSLDYFDVFTATFQPADQPRTTAPRVGTFWGWLPYRMTP